ncbi:hypothetical protein MNBD_GAMMA01-1450 [hydrothermal vent metagenome]|uniref:Uncharacterized protein n=1 Tax=hydrothermal vent metagenome TaxID=652676 RepID=A0A3B0WAB1_9ZZZZ
MRVVKYKKLLVLVLLIFVGQVVSAPLTTCATSESSSSSQIMPSMPDHDMAMMHLSQTHEAMVDMDCCGDECNCPQGMCISVVFYPNQAVDMQFVSIATYLIPPILFINNQYPSSIYRPPILS